MKLQIEREYVNFGKGHPGYSYRVRVMRDSRCIASAHWPGVNGPGASGVTVSDAKRLYKGPDDHPDVIAILARLACTQRLTMTTYIPDDLVLRQKQDGWSLYAPGSNDEDIDSGDAPYIVTGLGEPSIHDYERAFSLWQEYGDDVPARFRCADL